MVNEKLILTIEKNFYKEMKELKYLTNGNISFTTYQSRRSRLHKRFNVKRWYKTNHFELDEGEKFS